MLGILKSISVIEEGIKIGGFFCMKMNSVLALFSLSFFFLLDCLAVKLAQMGFFIISIRFGFSFLTLKGSLTLELSKNSYTVFRICCSFKYLLSKQKLSPLPPFSFSSPVF